MENVLNFLAEYSTAIHIIAVIGYIGIGAMIARAMPPKKPKSYGELHIIHYANDSKQLYLKLEDDIEKFEKDAQVCFDVVNDNVDAS